MGYVVAVGNLQCFCNIQDDTQLLPLREGLALEFGFERRSLQILAVFVKESVVVVELETALDDIRASLYLLKGKLSILRAEGETLQLRLTLEYMLHFKL